MSKIPIDEYGIGNCCPICGSMKIDEYIQFPLYVRKDKKTGKERFYIYKNGEKVYVPKPSNKMIANRYNNSQMDAQLWNYECRKCGWVSEGFTP